MQRFATYVTVGILALQVAAPAAANDWSWTLSGTGVTGSGVLTTAGDASSFVEVTAITGVFNGFAIAGIVPVGADPSGGYFYDNLFQDVSGEPHLTAPGILFNVPALGITPELGLVNLLYDGSAYAAVYSGVVPIPGHHDFTILSPVTFLAAPIAAAVPEPSAIGLMVAGMAGLGIARRRRVRA